MLSFLFGVECFVTLLDQEFEQPVEHGFGHGTDGVVDLGHITTLCDEFVTDLDSGFQEGSVQALAVDAQKFGDTVTFLCTYKKRSSATRII